MSDIEKGIRKHAKELLKKGKVAYVIGYEQSGKDRVRPFFAKSPGDADRLVWNKSCMNNLAVYLLENKKRVGIVAKGCDSRAIVELIKANQIKRDEIYIIGIPCEGVESGDGVLLDNCRVCRYKNPVIYDVLLGEEIEDTIEDDYSDVKEIESLSMEERFTFWMNEFERCIKCFACRNICPMCYCSECILEERDLQLVSKQGRNDEMFLFHLTRALHLAGTCVDCGACERACPVGIPLRLLYRKTAKDVKEFFNYEAGVDLNEKRPLAQFDPVGDEEI
ncbi:MAG: 4Fe-4S dicluster domain-containing protein [Candidatus Altiarchaeota archaeon]|nr:4Fe-4S dicluster domain-containing protein [Candidatus Altiarchaeota archaeon]